MKKIKWHVLTGIIMLWLTGIVASMVTQDLPPLKDAVKETVHTVPEEFTNTVTILQGQERKQMELEVYLTGVLLAELPGSFHSEAKKALAVAARTYALRKANFVQKHGAYTLCDDPACCQGYLSEKDFMSAGGNFMTVLQARQAVSETAGQVVTYDEKLIDATYFSCSGGRTEDAVAVWGTDIPYLQAVDSPGEENASYYTDTVRFTSEKFQEQLGVNLSGNPVQWFGRVVRTDGGGVQTIQIGGREYSGTQLRQLMDLRSANFTVTALNNAILITTRGYGHRVGLSQYGANAMAEDGADYMEILKHYYSGVEVEEMKKLGVAIGQE